MGDLGDEDCAFGVQWAGESFLVDYCFQRIMIQVENQKKKPKTNEQLNYYNIDVERRRVPQILCLFSVNFFTLSIFFFAYLLSDSCKKICLTTKILKARYYMK